MLKRIFLIYLGFTLFAFSGCAEVAFAPSDDQPINKTWWKVDDSLAMMEYFYTKGESTESIQIYRIKKDKFNISIHHSSDNPKLISEWTQKLPEANIIINGSYFHEDYSPSGYLKVNYNRIGERLFDQNLSGLVQIENNNLTIRDLAKEPLNTGEELQYGLQSYPFLIKNSVRDYKEDSGKEARRTVIGTDKQGNIYIILVDGHHISLYDLMVELIKSDIDFKHVLNLDGGTSSGIAINYNGYKELRDSLVEVPNVVVFSSR